MNNNLKLKYLMSETLVKDTITLGEYDRWCHVNNYLVRSYLYTDVIVVTNTATRRTNKA